MRARLKLGRILRFGRVLRFGRLRGRRRLRARLKRGRVLRCGRFRSRRRRRGTRDVRLRRLRLGGLDGHGRDRFGQQQRRIEQHRVLAQNSAALPGRLDEHRDERLSDRILRTDEYEVDAVGGAGDAKLERRQKLGAIEPVALEGFLARKLHRQTFALVERFHLKPDPRQERLVQRRADIDFAEFKRPCAKRRGQQRQDDPTCRYSHGTSVAARVIRRVASGHRAWSKPRIHCQTIPYKNRFAKISAICTLLSAAPLRMLSATIQRSSPLGCDRSSRMRPT